MTTANLRFAPDILRRLGEELVPHPDLGVMELVRNAYDADASTCTIELEEVDQPGGRVIVSDSGDGMQVEDIINGWLLLGRSPKVETTHSRGGRRKVGEKGLGRLAALRLGAEVTLETRPRNEPGVEHTLVIRWGDFDAVHAVEDVKLTVDRSETSLPAGTRIAINGLYKEFRPQDVARLARSLILLTGPFQGPADFNVHLNAPQFSELESLVEYKYFDEAEYFIQAQIDQDGQASATMTDWRGVEIASGGHEKISVYGSSSRTQPTMRYFAPPATFQLWTFNLSSDHFNVRKSKRSIREVREWLGAVGGVHLFHRGLRVHPYGDEGHDWLDMNLRRARSPELRPSTNTALGRVSVDDDGIALIPKTDRMGFLENEAFTQLAEFGRNVLDWAANERLRLREERRKEDKGHAKARTNQAWARVEDTIRRFPQEQRKVLRQVTNELKDAYDEKVNTVEQDLILYRTLATVGTTTAVFAHETKQPVDVILGATKILDRRVRKLVDQASFEERLQESFFSIGAAAASLRTYADIPLRMLQRRKRKSKVLDINGVIRDVVSLFAPHFERANIEVRLELAEGGAPVHSMVALIEAVVANLLANSMYAFTQPSFLASNDRVIVIQTVENDEDVFMTVLDSGPGIDTSAHSLEEIWRPGVTTREDGTGLGLTIVNDIVQDMDGKVDAKATCDLGGAEFVIKIPRAVSE